MRDAYRKQRIRHRMPITGPIPKNSNCETVRNLVGEVARAGWSSAIPVEVRMGSREGLPSSCVVNLDNLRTAACVSGSIPVLRRVDRLGLGGFTLKLLRPWRHR